MKERDGYAEIVGERERESRGRRERARRSQVSPQNKKNNKKNQNAVPTVHENVM